MKGQDLDALLYRLRCLRCPKVLALTLGIYIYMAIGCNWYHQVDADMCIPNRLLKKYQCVWICTRV